MEQEKMIPARYIGQTDIILAHFGGPYRDGNGKPLEDLVVRHGDTLMMREGEVSGFTIKFDPRGEANAEYLGIGEVVKPEDQGKERDVLLREGYQFHQGREDFEPYVVDAPEATA